MLSRRSFLLGTAATALAVAAPIATWSITSIKASVKASVKPVSIDGVDYYVAYMRPSREVSDYLAKIMREVPGGPIYSGEIGAWNGIVMRDEP